MKVTILTFGTRGDVEPLIALSLSLQAAGFSITLGADVDFAARIRELGIKHAPLTLHLRKFLGSDEGKTAMARGREPEGLDTFATMVKPMLDDCWAAAQGCDALIYDTMLCPVGWHIAEALQIPAMMTAVMPNMSPTREFAAIGAPSIPWMGRTWNQLSYQLYRVSWLMQQRCLRQWCRATIGQWRWTGFANYCHRNGRPVPVLYSYSQHVLPTPSDWNADTLASGYWFLDPASEAPYHPSPSLVAFLEERPQPLFVGFGSMVGQNPTQTTEIVVAAVTRAGQSALVATGWGGLDPAVCNGRDNIHSIDEAPHAWLFPAVRAVVHHGGAGTVAAGLRFGKPTVTCPFVTDQFFWGEIVYRRGWGPRPVPLRDLSVDRLQEAITIALGDAEMRKRAAALGTMLQAEDGLARAVQFITRHFRK